MAFQSGPFGYIGTIDDLSAYRMRGVDRIVVRKKSGVSKERIQNDYRYSRTRDSNQEWKACTMGMRAVRSAVNSGHIGDYNYTGDIVRVCKAVQVRETVHQKGQRSVLFSTSPFLLEGFIFNKYTKFNDVLRNTPECTVNRETGTALVKIPELVPGESLRNPLKQAMFCIHIILGAVPDIVFNDTDKVFKPAHTVQTHKINISTPWYTTQKGAPEQDMTIALPNWENKPGLSLVLTAGIRFGQPVSATEVEYTKYANAYKILKVV